MGSDLKGEDEGASTPHAQARPWTGDYARRIVNATRLGKF
jgi:hypothetical protein